ncbi:MAG: hypothetical protein GY842_01095 [bacterium]|nr:hypothetical protein [bacterium]
MRMDSFALATPSIHPLLSSRVVSYDREALRTGGLLALILVLAAVVRFGGLDRESRWGDEYLQTMSYAWPLQYVAMWSRALPQPPLDASIGWALFKIDDSVWMMRAPAAFFGVAGVGMCFVLGRKMGCSSVGLVAAALLAASPMHWRLSQTARPYTIYGVVWLVMLWTLMRALEHPTRRRLAVFGFTAVVLTLVRGMAPWVALLSVGLVLTALRVRGRRSSDGGDGEDAHAVKRVWGITVLAVFIGLPVLVYLLTGAMQQTTLSTLDQPVAQSYLAGFTERLTENALVWWHASQAMFGKGAPLILLLAALGVAVHLRRWRSLTLPVRCVCGVAWLVGPVHLVVFSVAVSKYPMADRYAHFLLPIVAVFAGSSLVGLLRWSQLRFEAAPTLQRMSGGALVLLVLASPAMSTLRGTGQYYNADWRGCADYLADKVTSGDVIMVFQDRPLGAYQPCFWGKHEWPDDSNRPLGESMWTLASSEAHWKRLLQASGRCWLVICHDFGGEPADAYRSRGLAVAPPGMELTKFRGLDLLRLTTTSSDALAEAVSACDTVLALGLTHPDAAAIGHVLRSRLLLHRGDAGGANAALERAIDLVPPRRQAWFTAATANHVRVLGESAP